MVYQHDDLIWAKRATNKVSMSSFCMNHAVFPGNTILIHVSFYGQTRGGEERVKRGGNFFTIVEFSEFTR